MCSAGVRPPYSIAHLSVLQKLGNVLALLITIGFWVFLYASLE